MSFSRKDCLIIASDYSGERQGIEHDEVFGQKGCGEGCGCH
jgi:hypothetical protein